VVRGLTLALVSGAIGGALAGLRRERLAIRYRCRDHLERSAIAHERRDDPRQRSGRYGGACATAWPPYLVPRRLTRGSAYRGLVGTIRRTDGWLQVTHAGHARYHYVGDLRPGQVLCQGVTEFGSGWYVVAPSGHVIR
jgi:hypothetical protein